MSEVSRTFAGLRIFPLFSTRSNPLGLFLVCDRTSAYQPKTQTEKAIKGIPKHITFSPDGPFGIYEAGLAIATISVDTQTALSAATLFNLCKRRANDSLVTSIVNGGFAEKGRLNTAKLRQTAVVSPCWLVTMMSAKNREARNTRKGAHA
jgi:hypothetical protein